MRHVLMGSASGLALTIGGGALLVAAGAGAVMLGTSVLVRRRARHQPPPDRQALSDADIRKITRNFLLYFVIPLWLAAGVADWMCHRATDIEDTTGTKETLIHLLMMVEMGVPVLAGLFLEINSPVLALMIAAFFLRKATAIWDVSYAVTARDVTPIEQHVHSFLEMLPLMAVGFISLLHWPKLLALVGLNQETDAAIRLKQEALPVGYVASTLGGCAIRGPPLPGRVVA